jgi:hypothetical protein
MTYTAKGYSRLIGIEVGDARGKVAALIGASYAGGLF